MKEKVYLDSTVPSYYFDEREALKAFTEVTRKWWSEMSGYYDLYISDAVLQEVSSGNYPRKDEIIQLISAVPLLPLISDLEQVVEFYISNYVMPMSLVGDALHLAYASYFDIQYLLTWIQTLQTWHMQFIQG